MAYQKAFDAWNFVKQNIENHISDVPYIRRGEIRWISFGINIGSEIDGKGDFFARPGLIIYVIGARRALVVPLTSKPKNAAGYAPLKIKNETNFLCINQMRVVSQKRIRDRIGKISNLKLFAIQKEIKQFFNFG